MQKMLLNLQLQDTDRRAVYHFSPGGLFYLNQVTVVMISQIYLLRRLLEYFSSQ